MKKVLLITEYLNPPYDEGIKKTVYNLFLDLNEKYELQVICRHGFKKNNIHIINVNPLFFSKEVKAFIRNFNPDALVYLPFQSSTFASYLRLKIFSIFAKTTKIIFIALQPKPIKKWQEFIVKYIKPKFALTPSPSLKFFWDNNNVTNQLIPLLTDLTVFKPIVNLNKKRNLREKYNLPFDSFIISHMGHLNEGRNLKSLIPLQSKDCQVVIIASSSTPKDAQGKISLRKELENSGIIIINKYIENIEEIYQLSDLYIFPVIEKNSSIGLPLSILEARACGLPVITTDYGSIKHYLDNDNDMIYYSIPEKFSNVIRDIQKEQLKDQSSSVYKLNEVFYNIIQKIVNLE